MTYLILIHLVCLFVGVKGVQLFASRQQSQKVDPRWNTIWTFWDYPNGPSPFVQLNLDTWKKHAPGMKLVLLNDTNMADYVPDLPKEYYRLPYASAKSDFVRASVLYHHGGVYMDTDFLLMKPLTPILEKLDTNDVVGYSDEDNKASGECGDHYSSNFMAAKKGNGFSETWWHNVRLKLTRECAPGEFGCEKVCCNEKGGPEHETRSCHIPWAQLEHLKMPWEDADRKPGGPKLDETNPANAAYIKMGKKMCHDLHGGKKQNLFAEAPAKNIPSNVTTYCLKGEDNLTPHLDGEIFWHPWDQKKGMTLWGKGRKMREYDDRFNCSLSNKGDVDCNKGVSLMGYSNLHMPKFFNRTAYHLFFSTRHVEVHSKEEILQGDWMISEMYRRSLGVEQKDAESHLYKKK